MSMALEVMKLIFAVLGVKLYIDHTVIIKRQFLYIDNNIIIIFAVFLPY